MPFRLDARHRHAAAGEALTVNLSASLPRGRARRRSFLDAEALPAHGAPLLRAAGGMPPSLPPPELGIPRARCWMRLPSSAAPLQRRGKKRG